MIRISKRLQMISSMVPKCDVVADIGTDHGYVPAFLLLSGQCSYVIASDIAEGPCRAARDTSARYNLQQVMDIRMASGLTGLAKGEANAVVIAGMGGGAIVQILEEGQYIADTVGAFVLQPMNAEGMLRQWLADHRYKISEEKLCSENGHIYVIIKINHSTDCQVLSELEKEVGPCILKDRPSLWREYLTIKAHRLQMQLEQMNASATAKNSQKFKKTAILLEQLMQILSS